MPGLNKNRRDADQDTDVIDRDAPEGDDALVEDDLSPDQFLRELRRGIREEIDSALEERMSGDGQTGDAPEVVPSGQRTGEARVDRQRDTDGPDGANVQTHRLLQAVATRDYTQVTRVQEHMRKAGMYEGAAWGKWEGEERAVALTSSEGAPFLPTTVDDRIEEIRENFGVVRRLCTVYNFNSGQHKIPNVSGRPKVFAVSEGSPIKTRKATWASETLDPEKWGVIRPYSSEMSDEVGAQWVQKVTEQVGRAFAEAEDETVLIADGTAAYHNLEGLLVVSGLTEHTLAGGNTSFEDMTYADGVELIKGAAAGERSRGTHVFHPDFMYIWALFTDPNNQYIYPPNSEIERLIRPAMFTEAMPSIGDDGADTAFGVFGNFEYVTMGFQRGVEVKLLDQATIIDTDDSTPIHLASIDSFALRFTARWDVKYALTDAFARIKTAAS